MRLIFTVIVTISVSSAPSVAAHSGRNIDLAAYRKLLGPGIPMTTRSCFAEHLCALGGAIGERWDCDTRADECVHSRAEPQQRNEGLWRKFSCDSFFGELTQQQIDFLAAPAGCETPPPPAALKTAITRDELPCIEKTMCGGIANFSHKTSCLESWDLCAGSLENLLPYKRQTCRLNRVALTVIGLCPMADSASPWKRATIAANAPRYQPGQISLRPKTWREQVERAKNSGVDEFSLGDLDFD